MTNKQKASIITRFLFKWVLPRVLWMMMALLILWVVFSTLEISVADCTQIGRDYWEYNLWGLLLRMG